MANTLKFGSGQWATKVGSTLAYNDEGGNFKPLPFTFDRSTSATRVNKDGLIEVVTNNKPRIDFLNDSKGALLLENSATNLVTYSEDFSQSYWVKATVSLASNQIISPDGTLNADKITESSTNGLQQIYSDVITTTPSSDYVYSIFIKKEKRSWVKVMTANNSGANFNVEDGVIGILDSGITANIENYGNGWFKCSVSFNTSASADRVYVRISTSNGVTSYQGDGTSGLYIWGAQLEAGSYATSYIPTQGSIGTRVAESCIQTPPSGIIGQTEGTIYWEIDVQTTVATANENVLYIDDGIDFSNSIYFRKSSSANLIGEMFVSGNIEASFLKANITKGVHKMAMAYANNNTAFFVDGVQVGITDTFCTVPLISRIQLGNTALSPSDCLSKNLELYNTRLTDAELISLTKI